MTEKESSVPEDLKGRLNEVVWEDMKGCVWGILEDATGKECLQRLGERNTHLLEEML
ncbi:MAG: hypothetical protein RMK18_10865 [Armatimonadota bacterium]|nr:hypothetical protein [Armatimonadota bacterium]MDW8026347.1 hypothetical protein [Armatimonadota bacterium]